MSTVKETRDFLTYLETTKGNWFSYLGVNLRANAFFVETEDENGDELYIVWSKGEVRYEGAKRDQAEIEFARRSANE